MLVGDGESDRAGAHADVEHARRVAELAQDREAALDDGLGLGPWHERARVGLQRQPAEAPLAEDVGERLPQAPARQQLVQAIALVRVEHAVALDGHARPRQPERVRQQQLRVHLRRRYAGLVERPRRLAQGLGDRHAAVIPGRGGVPRRPAPR
jgi:hypothetical protein